MEPAEYEKLNRLERDHWFYRGKREIVRHWIDRYVSVGPDDVLVDAGMGTGGWLAEMGSVCRVVGVDDHAESLALARPRLEAVGGTAIEASLAEVGLPDGFATVVTMLDVLEHLDDDAAALEEMARITRPGGLLVITVPALMWLWSDWDVALHHRRRYSRRGLLDLVSRPGLDVLHCAYINSLALLPVAGVRLWRKAFPPKPGAPRAEDEVPGPALNALLHRTFVGPARWGWFKPPLGVSLLAVLRRSEGPVGGREGRG